MNGHFTTTPIQTKIANLAAQVPPIFLARALATCQPADGNPHDLERELTGFVSRSGWIEWEIKAEADEILQWLDAEYLADYAERRDLYEIGMGR